ncbi:MAG: FtsQ-type POTRA domain-containing protein [Gammaproteobacteria bacterium]|nr:MAG: FtsQ-type POTRA domain-containing protein [Gammaproteobacteria bacterium]
MAWISRSFAGEFWKRVLQQWRTRVAVLSSCGRWRMARKQAYRRKRKQERTLKLPTLRLRRVVTPLLAVLMVVVTYKVSTGLLDRDIESIEISAPFQRVTALQIEEAVSDELDAGFLGADIGRMQSQVRALSWIDQVSVARRWPNRIAISVSEQVPAAIWGERGLLNVRGELFVDNARHIPAELPRLSGPADSSAVVAKRYLHVRDQLIPIGLDLLSVAVDARGAWKMMLTNGVEIRLGRREVDARTDLFIAVVADVITGQSKEIAYVDMRYNNGFTIGWKDVGIPPAFDPDPVEQEMLAARDTR